ncbi:hypothetical protein CapIbe_000115 [Capra ibex]
MGKDDGMRMKLGGKYRNNRSYAFKTCFVGTQWTRDWKLDYVMTVKKEITKKKVLGGSENKDHSGILLTLSEVYGN